MTARALVLLAVSAGAFAAPAPEKAARADGFFGVATRTAEGAICLQLRSEAPAVPVAESFACYAPGDPRYPMVRDHVGEIRPGQEKVIAPFPSTVPR